VPGFAIPVTSVLNPFPSASILQPMNLRHLCIAFFAPILVASVVYADDIPLGELGVGTIQQEYGKPQVDLSVEGHPLTIGGTHYAHGIGTHAQSTFIINTGGRATKLTALVGVDDEVKDAADVKKFGVDFKVIGDGKKLFDSKTMHAGDPAKAVDVDLTGVKTLLLLVSPVRAITYGHADWVNAAISYTGEKPVAVAPPPEVKEVLTPKAPPTPRINSAKVVGVRPTHPLLFTIAATGDRPMTFSADGLPEGLSLDSSSGFITGSVVKAGSYLVKVHASNSLGKADGDLRIEVGDRIALTPPMGWNSWNCFATAVSDEKVRAAADAMVKSGLINHGWTYINIDDCWEVRSREPEDKRRAPDGHILTNNKFPDMKALVDYIHSKGLRAGLYSSPGPSTCGGFTASYQFEETDAKQYAQWGFDYLKYDWCSYGDIASKIKKEPNPPSQLEIYQHPYRVMGDALKKQDRDILYSLCQYGMGDVWKWGEQVGGNCWRTTGDINDSWGSLNSIGFSQNGHEKYAGPGHWNDPDMLVVGMVGWGPALHPTHLTPNEQYLHITLWSLLSSPLLIGCDMTQLDDFTTGLLSNDEVIAVNQDPLGKPAGRITQTEEGYEVWARDLADGSKAVGLFNRSELPAQVSIKWSDLQLTGPQKVRDIWREKDLETQETEFKANVNRHGAVFIKLTPAR
jgi:alpha-galactosidase